MDWDFLCCFGIVECLCFGGGGGGGSDTEAEIVVFAFLSKTGVVAL